MPQLRVFPRLFFAPADDLGTTGGSAPASEPAAPDTSADTSTQSTSESQGVTPGTVAPPSEPASSATGSPAAQTPATLFDRISSAYGVDYRSKYQSEDDLLKGLVNASKLVSQRNQYAELGQTIAPHWQQFQAYLQQMQAQNQQPQQPKKTPAQEYAEKVAWNRNWDAYTQLDENNQVVLRPDAPIAIQEAWHARNQARAEFARNLVERPHEALQPILADVKQQWMQEVQQQWGQREQQVRLQTEADQLRDANADWLYLHDSNTKQRLTDEFGRPALSPAGHAFMNNLYAVQQTGVQNQKAAFQYAFLMTREQMGLRNAQQAAPNPAPPTAQRQANTATNRGRDAQGRFVPQPEGGGSMKFEEMLRKGLRENPEALREMELPTRRAAS